jgi:hypothetical protein
MVFVVVFAGSRYVGPRLFPDVSMFLAIKAQSSDVYSARRQFQLIEVRKISCYAIVETELGM